MYRQIFFAEITHLRLHRGLCLGGLYSCQSFCEWLIAELTRIVRRTQHC
jgi:hypothetical protein